MASGLIKRSLAGLLLIAIMIGGMLSPYTFCLVSCFALAVMMHEYYAMSPVPSGYSLERFLAIFSVTATFLMLMAVFELGMNPKYLLLLFIPYCAVLTALLFNPVEQTEAGHKTEYILFPMLYVGVPFGFLPFMMYGSDGEYTWRFFLFAFLLIWMSDIGAYVLGMTLGQKPDSKKLYPSVSPKKSWMGVWGGILFTLAIAIFLHFTSFIEMPLIHYVAIAFLVVLFGILGDLSESLIKRHYGVKDSGNIIPGHGGLLDRFDSALFVIPIIVVYLNLFSII
ncbi:MAG: phosphatidate cytidylyltransferase [Bacteroidales bacterium]|nr:phosphatidate cytidylyltransferase [Bacteroidales bacterium]